MEHACDLLNKYYVRTGNKTAWESIKKGPYTGDVYRFGAPVMHRLSGPVQGGVIHERWHDGVYLGTQFSSGEHIVAMLDGTIVRARAIQPKPEGVPTTKASLDVIASGPAGGSAAITQRSSSPVKRAEDGNPGASASDPVPRGFRVTKDLLDKFDYSKGCPRCESLRRGDRTQTTHHSKECRKRIEASMREDPELKKKLGEVEEKQNRWIGRRIEAHDAHATSNAESGQSSMASVPEGAMICEQKLEQWPVGPETRPSSQWGGKGVRRGNSKPSATYQYAGKRDRRPEEGSR